MLSALFSFDGGIFRSWYNENTAFMLTRLKESEKGRGFIHISIRYLSHRVNSSLHSRWRFIQKQLVTEINWKKKGKLFARRLHWYFHYSSTQPLRQCYYFFKRSITLYEFCFVVTNIGQSLFRGEKITSFCNFFNKSIVESNRKPQRLHRVISKWWCIMLECKWNIFHYRDRTNHNLVVVLLELKMTSFTKNLWACGLISYLWKKWCWNKLKHSFYNRILQL